MYNASPARKIQSWNCAVENNGNCSRLGCSTSTYRQWRQICSVDAVPHPRHTGQGGTHLTRITQWCRPWVQLWRFFNRIQSKVLHSFHLSLQEHVLLPRKPVRAIPSHIPECCDKDPGDKLRWSRLDQTKHSSEPAHNPKPQTGDQ